jgi:hypothetical protein
MRSVLSSSLSGLVLLGLCAMPVTASEPEKADALSDELGESWLLAKYDSNGDKVISADEISQKRDRVFGLMDADADGLVSLDEYALMDSRKRQLVLKARFAKLDLDKNGAVSTEEYRSYMGSFERFDADGDGQITASEIDSSKREQKTEKTREPRCLLWVCVRTQLD